MNWLRTSVDLILWATPVALIVTAVGPSGLQRRVLPVLALLILFLTVGAVYRFWPRRDRERPR